MYLKSIEVQGFKSFANKIVFEFHNGITGIVGPNGSGKSNVADAVRWVLGEQSAKQLRGAKMEDIIFSGTESRKALGFAYVAITLDNKDHKLPIEYDEVTVARRVYRSGESEYLINTNSCRLRDVQELFLDTGIGKEGYSIIGQGQIDKILSGKPEDRRELFDEAAGIVKFKKRKAIAEKNLEEEKQNLHRINDILSEIEKQVVPLEKQSGVAKDYLKLKEELKVLDVNLFLSEYDRIHEDSKKVKENLSIASIDLERTTKDYSNTKEEYDTLEIQIEEYNQELENCTSNLSEKKLCAEKLEGEIKVLKEQINGMKQQEVHFKDRISSIQVAVEDKNKDLGLFDLQKNELDQKLAVLKEDDLLNKSEQDKIFHTIADTTREMEQSNSEIISYLNENASIKSRLQRYETMLEQNNIKKAELNQKLLKYKSTETVIEDEISSYTAELKGLEEKISRLTKLNDGLGLKNSEVQRNIEEYTRTLSLKQQEYHGEKSRLDSLKNMTERYDGYGNSIRKVMEQKDHNAGIIGVVADIIKVNKQYETAVETALGGSIQNIVTDNENTAKQQIEFLKKNKFGRATFLPLTSMSGKTGIQRQEVLQEKGVIGLASSLIETQSRFQGLVEHLLGRVVVVDHIDNAIALAKKYSYSLRIVTTEGEQLNPGGSMSGGAYKNSSNLLGRRREMEDLKKKVDLIVSNIKNSEQFMEIEKEEKKKNKEAIEENKNNIQQFSLSQNTAKMNLNQALEKKQEGVDQYREITLENREIESQTKELKVNIAQINGLLQINIEKSQENEVKIQELSGLLEAERLYEKDFNNKSSQLKSELSALEQNKQFILENGRRVKGEITKLEEELREINENASSATLQVKEKEEKIQNTETDLNDIRDYTAELLVDITSIKGKKEALSKSHKAFFTKREELSQQISGLDKEIFRLNNQFERLSELLENQIDYMWDEYELTYGSSLTLKTEGDMSLAQTKKNIGELKVKIKNLGDVNVNAIEDYKNLVERFELLKAQRDDLVKAEDVLKGIIEELDNEMRKQFHEKFQAIKDQFDIVFKELFGGGKGTLALMEEEDILESGIRIIAQPPGKKLQNMMQLSGGEKALTAISLLFAIQNLKPSPFCLLDEIEAALDDSNVKRYAKYLHKLTKDTQFIIITHRRGTMAAADVLYGITMQEKGVSTLVSVNLIENELEK